MHRGIERKGQDRRERGGRVRHMVGRKRERCGVARDAGLGETREWETMKGCCLAKIINKTTTKITEKIISL